MGTYLEAYPLSPEGVGLILDLGSIEGIPWSPLGDEVIASMEQAYYIRSGNKTLASLFNALSNPQKAKVVAAMFAQKWTRLWNAYALEYNALDAYTLTETGNREKDTTGTDTTTFGRKVKESGTDTGTVDTTGTDNSNTNDSVYGFNSAMPVPTDTGTDATETTGKETRNLATSRDLENSGEDSTATVGTEKENYSYTKKGNIGYTTPQRLIREEFELWREPFLMTVFRDIDSYITISVF